MFTEILEAVTKRYKDILIKIAEREPLFSDDFGSVYCVYCDYDDYRSHYTGQLKEYHGHEATCPYILACIETGIPIIKYGQP